MEPVSNKLFHWIEDKNKVTTIVITIATTNTKGKAAAVEDIETGKASPSSDSIEILSRTVVSVDDLQRKAPESLP